MGEEENALRELNKMLGVMLKNTKRLVKDVAIGISAIRGLMIIAFGLASFLGFFAILAIALGDVLFGVVVFVFFLMYSAMGSMIWFKIYRPIKKRYSKALKVEKFLREFSRK